MAQKYISIIDLGTGSIRNSVYDLKGNLAACNRTENPVFYPRPGWAEQDPVLWWKILKESYHALPDRVRTAITAISVTSQREGIVPVNSDFEPIDNIIIWLDGRTGKEAEVIEKKLGRKTIYDICGLVPHPVWSLSKILWLKSHKPEVYQKSCKLLQAEDYFVSRLARKAVTEFSIANIIKTFDIEADKLPELMEPGSFAGIIHPAVAEEFKLSSRTKIFTGAGDQQAAAVGSGAVFEGSVSIGIGTSSALSFTISRPVPDPSGNIILNFAALPGMWEYEPPIWNTGGLIKWYFDQVEQDNSGYMESLEKTGNIPPGSDGLIVLPYFSGSGSPRWNPDQKGVFYGLTLAHNRIHMLKAIMEGVAFEIKYNIDTVKKSGIAISKIILSGGASRNLPLCRIIADTLQMPLEISAETEASSKGCFILLKAALENNRNYREIFNSMKQENEIISPNTEYAEEYKGIYQKYLELGNLFDKTSI